MISSKFLVETSTSPWIVDEYHSVELDEFGNLLRGEPRIVAQDGTIVSNVAGGIPLYEAIANAQLLAAAPKLYSTLLELVAALNAGNTETIKRLIRQGNEVLDEVESDTLLNEIVSIAVENSEHV